MNNFVSILNSIITQACDWLLWPFSSPTLGLTIASLFTGVALLLIYGKVSNQKAIRAAKSRIYGSLLEVVLYRHELRLCLGAQRALFKETARYFLLAVPPVLVLALPCLLILAQLNQRYGLRPFSTEEAALLKVKLSGSSKLFNTTLAGTSDLEITAPVRVAGSNEIYWRVKSISPSAGRVILRTGALALPSTIEFGNKSSWLEPLLSSSWFWRLFYPTRESASDILSEVEELSLDYPETDYSLLGLRMHWLLFFFIISLAGGLVASKIFKVEI